MLKKIRKISIIVIVSLLASNLLAYALLRTPAVQTYLVGKLTNYLSQKLNTVARIEGVDIEFFSKIVLEGIYIEDLHKDTLLHAGKLKVDIKKILIEKNIINLKAVTLEECRVNLIQYKNDEYILEINYDKDTQFYNQYKV